MRTKYLLPLLIIALSSNMFGQKNNAETVGFDFTQHYRHLDDYKVNSNIWALSYRYLLPTNTRVAASIGIDNSKLFLDDDDTKATIKSDYQIFAQFETLQTIVNYLYLKGAVQYYTIKGRTCQTAENGSKIQNYNQYNMFEFPLGAGITVPTQYFDVFLGINKPYYYGNNQKEVFVVNGDDETSIGTESKRTFKSELDIAVEGTAVIHLVRDIDIEIGAIKYADKDFSIKLSIWGPLKRMY